MQEWLQIALGCIKCAKCIPTCQMYQSHRDEVHSPRGLLSLLSLLKTNEDSKYIAYTKEALDSCLLCEHCSKHCPKDLKIDLAIRLARTDLNKTQMP